MSTCLWLVANTVMPCLTQDDYGVNREYKYAVIIAVAFIPVYLCLAVLPSPKLHVDVFDPSLIFIATMVTVFCCLVTWPAVRTFRTHNKDFGALNRLSVEHTDLHEVLNSNLYFLFIEHLKSEFSVENCLFWKEVEQLKTEYGPSSNPNNDSLTFSHATRLARSASAGIRKSSGSTAFADRNVYPIDVCKDIVDMFVKDGAAMEVRASGAKVYAARPAKTNGLTDRPRILTPYVLAQVNISSKVKEKILMDLHYEELEAAQERETADGVALGGDIETVSAKIFEEAQAQIFRLMETDSLPRFKKGKLFKNYTEAMAEGRGGGLNGKGESKDIKGSGKQKGDSAHGIELAKVMGASARANGSNGGRGGNRGSVGKKSDRTSDRSVASGTSVGGSLSSSSTSEMIKNDALAHNKV